jgi:hypothetical protein
MKHVMRRVGGFSALLIAGLTWSAGAQMRPGDSATAPGIIPTGFGESVDRDVARARAATARFKVANDAIAAGYPRTSDCVDNPPHGAMGFHHNNDALMDTTLDVEKPEVLVYERMSDGTFKLNGVEYLVPIAAWTRDEPPTIMGQKLKRAEKLGIWYLHVWIWEPSPSGIFADWNPRVKCGK